MAASDDACTMTPGRQEPLRYTHTGAVGGYSVSFATGAGGS